MASRELIIRKVDVFTRQPGQGNPAAVVLDARALLDQQMLSIAAQARVSETAFVLPARPREADVRIRWFTPACEVSMCGHATIAAVHVLSESDLLPAAARSRPLRIATRGGLLQATIEKAGAGDAPAIIWLDLVPPQLVPQPLEPYDWAPLLGVPEDGFVDSPPPARSQDEDLIVFVADAMLLNGAAPNMAALAAYCRERAIRGVCVSTVATVTQAISVQSRFFAPAVGVDEDPVTGSVHGPLAVHLVGSGAVPTFNDLAALTCLQGIPAGRGGLVRVLVQRRPDGHCEVRIGGECVSGEP